MREQYQNIVSSVPRFKASELIRDYGGETTAPKTSETDLQGIILVKSHLIYEWEFDSGGVASGAYGCRY